MTLVVFTDCVALVQTSPELPGGGVMAWKRPGCFVVQCIRVKARDGVCKPRWALQHLSQNPGKNPTAYMQPVTYM